MDMVSPTRWIERGWEDLRSNPVPGLVHGLTLTIGLLTMAFLFWARSGLKPLLLRLGLNQRAADIITKAGPVLAIVVAIVLVFGAISFVLWVIKFKRSNSSMPLSFLSPLIFMS